MKGSKPVDKSLIEDDETFKIMRDLAIDTGASHKAKAEHNKNIKITFRNKKQLRKIKKIILSYRSCCEEFKDHI